MEVNGMQPDRIEPERLGEALVQPLRVAAKTSLPGRHGGYGRAGGAPRVEQSAARMLPPIADLHGDEVRVSEAVVRALLGQEYPALQRLPVRRVATMGSDNALFRVGARLCVRLPRHAGAAQRVATEAIWLPVLAPSLPLQVPEVVALCGPSELFPFPWLITTWIDGHEGSRLAGAEREGAARMLATFLRALQRANAAGAPSAGGDRGDRGVPLVHHHEAFAASLARADRPDRDRLMRLWGRVVAAEPWRGTPAWLHGDLRPGSLLIRDGRLVAVVSFGRLGVGDPARDLQVAWTMLGPRSRAVFRDVLESDEASWRRGMGWALMRAVVATSRCRRTNPTLGEASRRTIEQIASAA